MYRFLIVIEKANGNYSAYCPDLPGCAATGKTREETERNMHEVVERHVQGMLEDNLPIPDSVTKSPDKTGDFCFRGWAGQRTLVYGFLADERMDTKARVVAKA